MKLQTIIDLFIIINLNLIIKFLQDIQIKNVSQNNLTEKIKIKIILEIQTIYREIKSKRIFILIKEIIIVIIIKFNKKTILDRIEVIKKI